MTRGDDVVATVTIPRDERKLEATRIVRILRIGSTRVQLFGDPVAVGDPVELPVGSLVVICPTAISDESPEAWAAVVTTDRARPLAEIARARGARRLEELTAAIKRTEFAALVCEA